MAEVVLQNVSRVYAGGVRAVDGMNLHMRDGELITLVGPSGCGKSTTLRLIAGLEELNAGTIRIGDRVVNEWPPRDRDVAMVFQNSSLYSHLSVHENIAFSLKMRRRELGLSVADIERAVHEAAALLGIEPLLHRRPHELSGGQAQRVALGRAIVRRPKAFLFDEPLSNLDSGLRLKMRGEIKRLHQRLGTTTLYVTHDQEEAMTLGDRVAVMKDGVVQQVAEPLEVYHRPANRFVAGFIGSPPMNFIEGYVRRGESGLEFDDGEHRFPLPARRVEAAARFVDQPLTLGIRPQHLSLEPSGSHPSTIYGKIVLVEPLGEDADVQFSTRRQESLTARVKSHLDMRPGQQVRLFVDMKWSYLFEPSDMRVIVTNER